jgi:hypothetical protein
VRFLPARSGRAKSSSRCFSSRPQLRTRTSQKRVTRPHRRHRTLRLTPFRLAKRARVPALFSSHRYRGSRPSSAGLPTLQPFPRRVTSTFGGPSKCLRVCHMSRLPMASVSQQLVLTVTLVNWGSENLRLYRSKTHSCKVRRLLQPIATCTCRHLIHPTMCYYRYDWMRYGTCSCNTWRVVRTTCGASAISAPLRSRT